LAEVNSRKPEVFGKVFRELAEYRTVFLSGEQGFRGQADSGTSGWRWRCEGQYWKSVYAILAELYP